LRLCSQERSWLAGRARRGRMKVIGRRW
jgi:hypothetical protein